VAIEYVIKISLSVYPATVSKVVNIKIKEKIEATIVRELTNIFKKVAALYCIETFI
jgi:hypothetical protein